MRQADCWEPPEDSTIGGVASRIVREQSNRGKVPILFHYDSESAQRGRVNAGRKAHDQAAARRQATPRG